MRKNAMVYFLKVKSSGYSILYLKKTYSFSSTPDTTVYKENFAKFDFFNSSIEILYFLKSTNIWGHLKLFSERIWSR